MAVALTTTVNTGFGSKVYCAAGGVLLNNQMDDFSSPGTPNVYGIPPSPANFIRCAGGRWVEGAERAAGGGAAPVRSRWGFAEEGRGGWLPPRRGGVQGRWARSAGRGCPPPPTDPPAPGPAPPPTLPPPTPARPGKKPFSSMSPVVVAQGGALRAVLGASGGPRIISSVLQALLRWVGGQAVCVLWWGRRWRGWVDPVPSRMAAADRAAGGRGASRLATQRCCMGQEGVGAWGAAAFG